MSLQSDLVNLITTSADLLVELEELEVLTKSDGYNVLITRDENVDDYPEVDLEKLENDVEKAIEVLKVAPVGNGYCIIVDDGFMAALNRIK